MVVTSCPISSATLYPEKTKPASPIVSIKQLSDSANGE